MQAISEKETLPRLLLSSLEYCLFRLGVTRPYIQSKCKCFHMMQQYMDREVWCLTNTKLKKLCFFTRFTIFLIIPVRGKIVLQCKNQRNNSSFASFHLFVRVKFLQILRSELTLRPQKQNDSDVSYCKSITATEIILTLGTKVRSVAIFVKFSTFYMFALL